MGMNAKIFCRVAEEDQAIDVFGLVDSIEKAINKLVRERAETLRQNGEHALVVMRREKMSYPETTIRPTLGSCRVMYTRFALSEHECRNLQILLEPADQEVLPEKGTVLLSLGMGGDYKEILFACGQALSGNNSFVYTDDSLEEYLTGDELQQLIEKETPTVQTGQRE